METSQLVGLPPAVPARSEVSGRGARRLLVQGPVQVASDALPSPVASQHTRWTQPPPLAILTGG
jgi:hypothetical protein